MTTENRDLTQVSLVFAHTSTHKDQRLSILFFFLFLGGKSGLITHNQNLYVNKKMGKNLFLQKQILQREIFRIVIVLMLSPYCTYFSWWKHFQNIGKLGWLILLSKSPPLMSLSTFDTTSIMATTINVLFHLFSYLHSDLDFVGCSLS